MKSYLRLTIDADLSELPELYESIQNYKEIFQNQIALLQQIIDLIDSMLIQGNPVGQDCLRE